jgi:rhodanese-related sulfurtransferase
MANPLSNDALEVTPEQAAQALADGSATIVDVREGYEWEAGRIPGTVHIELERLASRADSIDKDRPVIFQCRAGVRSLMAAQAFAAAGFDARSMTGGIKAWADEGRPLEPDGGVVADH